MAREQQENGELETLNRALRDFWKAADALPEDAAQDEINEALMDKANSVFLARDDVLRKESLSACWNQYVDEMTEMVSDCLAQKNVVMNGQAVQTTTGRATYRILLHRSF